MGDVEGGQLELFNKATVVEIRGAKSDWLSHPRGGGCELPHPLPLW